MNSQVFSLLPPQAQSFAVQATPLDVSNKPDGVARPIETDRFGSATHAVEEPKQSMGNSRDDLGKTLDLVNKSLNPFEVEARFTMSKRGQRVIITLRNTRTGEVIRKIPPEDFTSMLKESTGGVGMWFNGKV